MPGGYPPRVARGDGPALASNSAGKYQALWRLSNRQNQKQPISTR
jgi:hypothetical protein